MQIITKLNKNKSFDNKRNLNKNVFQHLKEDK